jgi:DNA-binding transcriptional LysR family regulator
MMEPGDIKLLRVFAAVVEAGGFTAAEGDLHLSLSTISGRIRDLEIRLGVQLCKRGRGGFSLTDEGAAVYDEARRLFATVEAFDRRVKGLRSSMTGQITLGLTDNTLTDRNAPIEAVLARFCEMAPDVALTVVTKPPNELLRDVVSGQVQVAVASFPRQALGLAYDNRYSEQQQFYCGVGHPLFQRDDAAIDVGEVRVHAIVARGYWGARDLKMFAISAPRAVVSDMEAEARLILSGRFLGYLPEHLAQQFVQQGRMRPLRPDLFGYRALFQAAYDPIKARRPVVAAMIRAILTELRPG